MIWVVAHLGRPQGSLSLNRFWKWAVVCSRAALCLPQIILTTKRLVSLGFFRTLFPHKFNLTSRLKHMVGTIDELIAAFHAENSKWDSTLTVISWMGRKGTSLLSMQSAKLIVACSGIRYGWNKARGFHVFGLAAQMIGILVYRFGPSPGNHSQAASFLFLFNWQYITTWLWRFWPCLVPWQL